MKPENTPYYHGPRITSTLEETNDTPSDEATDTAATHHSHYQSVMSAIIDHNCCGLSHLSNIPVRFGNFDKVTPITLHVSMNHKIPAYVHQVLWFNWAVYSFGGGHFASTISSCNLPFNVQLACDQYEFGCALFLKLPSSIQQRE
jgi:hypothetical protein